MSEPTTEELIGSLHKDNEKDFCHIIPAVADRLRSLTEENERLNKEIGDLQAEVSALKGFMSTYIEAFKDIREMLDDGTDCGNDFALEEAVDLIYGILKKVK